VTVDFAVDFGFACFFCLESDAWSEDSKFCLAVGAGLLLVHGTVTHIGFVSSRRMKLRKAR